MVAFEAAEGSKALKKSSLSKSTSIFLAFSVFTFAYELAYKLMRLRDMPYEEVVLLCFTGDILTGMTSGLTGTGFATKSEICP